MSKMRLITISLLFFTALGWGQTNITGGVDSAGGTPHPLADITVWIGPSPTPTEGGLNSYLIVHCNDYAAFQGVPGKGTAKGTRKLIRDLFPEECGVDDVKAIDVPTATQYIQRCDSNKDFSEIYFVMPEHWTCSDISRILFTAEDGTRWCHKPNSK
jgi:hypothetical protein